MFEELLARLARALDETSVPYMVYGGQAVLIHGEPRFTRDIDVSLGVDDSRISDVLKVMERCGLESAVPDPQSFVARTFILPANHKATHIRVDFCFTVSEFERLAISRAERRHTGGYPVCYASPEDLILHKLFAGRPRDIEDIRGILARKRAELDVRYLRKWAKEFSTVEGRESLPKQVNALLKEFK